MSLSFLSKSNPLISNVKKGKFLTPWFLAPFILYYITQYFGPLVLPLHHYRLLPLGQIH